MAIVSYTFGRALRAAPRSENAPGRPAERRGVPDNGRIVKLYIGRGHGFIRATDAREIYFHRGGFEEGTSINDYQVGDLVSFERIEDVVSGPRAICVRRQQTSE